MLRRAVPMDIPNIVSMTKDLAAATCMPVPVDDTWTAAFVRRLIPHPDGLALVVDRGRGAVGMLIASIGQIPVSPVRVAGEHGWWCGPEARGWGTRLLHEYENWARSKACFAARMSTAGGVADPAGAARLLLKDGWRSVEQAWIKVL